MAGTNEHGVPVHPWSWVPSHAGFLLIGVPLFLVAIEVAAWRSPWVLGAIAGGLGSSAVAWVLDRESSRQTRVVRAHLGMRWGETTQDWRAHRTDALCWTLSLAAAWPAHAAGGPWWVVALILLLNGRLAASNGVSALQGWRREREDRSLPPAPAPLVSGESVS
ncbi:hypothetical protein [Nocardioides zeae]|uniref:Uncharacterized protein n=1 Tax=Nocardioides zeae TaxID=1457234 RepID=A0AAJ1TYM3_9ACTN|nr:hypothetical protein [Nocardioides zeae]MDQ1104761.1 hypothetical protein [Nocardioides zeae]